MNIMSLQVSIDTGASTFYASFVSVELTKVKPAITTF